MNRFLTLFLVLLLAACAAKQTPPSPTPVPASLPAPTASSPPRPSPVSTLTASPSPTSSPTDPASRFPLLRPIPGASVDRSYPYGGTQNGTREVHHGVEFYQPFGTPVLAAGPGRVAFAGEDKLTLLGWVTGFYGKVIVLEHQVNGQALYTLYGHLSEIRVETGEVVTAAQQIGAVGASGIAIGSHLHFEVRLGANDYKSTRNPELWLQPLDGTGVLAGRILDAAGNPLRAAVNIQRMENGAFNPASVGSALAYPRETLNSDETLRETFAVGELPAGEYRVSFVHQGVLYEEVVTIPPGGLAFVEFVAP